jgi:hypothetical protein
LSLATGEATLSPARRIPRQLARFQVVAADLVAGVGHGRAAAAVLIGGGQGFFVAVSW